MKTDNKKRSLVALAKDQLVCLCVPDFGVSIEPVTWSHVQQQSSVNNHQQQCTIYRFTSRQILQCWLVGDFDRKQFYFKYIIFLELACNGSQCRGISLICICKDSLISLICKLVPVLYREYEYGLLSCDWDEMVHTIGGRHLP